MSQRRRRRDGPPKDRAWSDFTESFRQGVLPKLLSSTYLLTIAEGVPIEVTKSVIQAGAELGVMLLLGKPLILLVPTGQVVPDGLRRAATVVVDDVDMDDPATLDRIADAFRQIGAIP